MAYKCKVCGYKFKKGDDSLCPNCFTARDDKDGFLNIDYSESNGSGSFLEDELRREKTPTIQELTGSLNRTADRTVKDFRTQQNNKRYQAAQNSIGTVGNYNRRSNFTVGTNNTRAKKTPRVIKLFIVLAILAPILKGFLSITKYVQKQTDEVDRAQVVENEQQDSFDYNTLDQQYSYDYENSSLLFSSSLSGLDNTSVKLKCVGQINDDRDFDEGDAAYYLDYQDPNLDIETQLYSFELLDESGLPINGIPQYCCIYGIDANSSQCYSYYNYTGEMIVRVNPTVKYYSLCAVYEDSEGNQTSSTFLFSLDDFLNSADPS